MARALSMRLTCGAITEIVVWAWQGNLLRTGGLGEQGHLLWRWLCGRWKDGITGNDADPTFYTDVSASVYAQASLSGDPGSTYRFIGLGVARPGARHVYADGHVTHLQEWGLGSCSALPPPRGELCDSVCRV